MTILSRPVRAGAFTLHGVDDWLCFATDANGRWFYFATECSPMWRLLPRSFDGPDGYPADDAGVFASAWLEARAGIVPRPCDADSVAELDALFGTAARVRRARDLVAAAERDLGVLSRGQVRDLLADNTAWPGNLIRDIAAQIFAEDSP